MNRHAESDMKWDLHNKYRTYYPLPKLQENPYIVLLTRERKQLNQFSGSGVEVLFVFFQLSLFQLVSAEGLTPILHDNR
jgi:hypothetical protein